MENFDENIFSYFEDDEFITWVASKSDSSDAYWKEWMQKNPGKVNGLLKARQIAQDLSKAQKPLSTEKKVTNSQLNMPASIPIKIMFFLQKI